MSADYYKNPTKTAQFDIFDSQLKGAQLVEIEVKIVQYVKIMIYHFYLKKTLTSLFG